MFNLENVPASYYAEASNLNNQVEALQKKIVEFQRCCAHEPKKAIMLFKADYRPRLDSTTGSRVIDHFHCERCELDIPIDLPFRQCWKCGGKMNYDRQEQYGMDRASVYKCENCSHEYDTT